MKWFSAWDVLAFGLLVAVTTLVMVGCGGTESEPEAAAVSAEPVQEEPEWPVPDDPALLGGMEVFANVCHHCHIEGEYLPTLTDTRLWNQRTKRNSRDGAVARDVFVQHAIEGFGDMGARGGRRGKDLTDEQVTAAVDYMLWAVAHLAPPPEASE